MLIHFRYKDQRTHAGLLNPHPYSSNSHIFTRQFSRIRFNDQVMNRKYPLDCFFGIAEKILGNITGKIFI
jgi:hypothetical protein